MLFTRESIERRENETLAPYACRSADSRGRMYTDTQDRYRTIYQRDRDRVLYTAAFRRLEYKTQVFVNFEGDYYRTRLTHTLEVAQIGRSLARSLGANEDLVETICLAHDLGHPPFGHSGEWALDRLMQDHGGFNHNLQTYRILTELEERYPNWAGLNLSYEVREGIAQHVATQDFRAKIGFDPTLRGTMEAQIADLADSLAYSSHDLDDGLRAGLFGLEQVAPLAIWQEARRQSGWGTEPFDDSIRYRMIRRVVQIVVEDVLAATEVNITRYKPQSPDDIRRLPENIVCYSDRVSGWNTETLAFFNEHLYHHYRIVRMQQRADRTISALFEAFIKAPDQLSPDVKRWIAVRGLHRTVCDYLAGMTDRYALEEWQRLFDPFTRP